MNKAKEGLVKRFSIEKDAKDDSKLSKGKYKKVTESKFIEHKRKSVRLSHLYIILC